MSQSPFRNNRCSADLKTLSIPKFNDALKSFLSLKEDFEPDPKSDLWSHQQQALIAAIRLEMSEQMCEDWHLRATWGILGLENGAGKTRIILSLVKMDLKPSHILDYTTQAIGGTRGLDYSSWGHDYPCQWTRRTSLDINRDLTIIVVPKRLASQWHDEAKAINMDLDGVWCEEDIPKIKLSTVLCHFSLVPKLISHRHPKRVIFDEAHDTRFLTMASVTWFTWYVTSDYMKLLETDSIYTSHMRPGWILKSTNTVRSDQIIRSVYSVTRHLPPPLYSTVVVRDNSTRYQLSKFLKLDEWKNILASGNISLLIKAIGGKEESTKEALFETLQKRISSTYRRFVAAYKLQKNEGGEYKSLLKKAKEWRRRYYLLKETRTNSTKDCTICLGEPENLCHCYSCMSSFCSVCLLTWLSTKSTCPNCRETIDESKLVYVTDVTPQTKLGALEDILKKGKKTVVFSYNVQVGDKLTERRLKEFKDGDRKVLYINSWSQASGLNLHNADQVVLYHKMNPELERQSIGRCQRPPRNEILKIYRLEYDWESL